MGCVPKLPFDPRCRPNPEYRPLKNFLVWVVFFAVVLVLVWWLYPDDAAGAEPTESASADVEPSFADAQQVEQYIKHFLRGVRVGKRWRGAQELSGLIVEHAAAPEAYWAGKAGKSKLVLLEPVDPLLVAVNFSLESSFFQRRKGGVGELGVGQIHPLNTRALTRPDGTLYDMTQRDDQVAAGVRELAYQAQRCSSLEQAFTAYKYGACRPVHGVGPYRTKVYRKARRIVGLDPLK